MPKYFTKTRSSNSSVDGKKESPEAEKAKKNTGDPKLTAANNKRGEVNGDATLC